jgi:hypothetical protein
MSFCPTEAMTKPEQPLLNGLVARDAALVKIVTDGDNESGLVTFTGESHLPRNLSLIWASMAPPVANDRKSQPRLVISREIAETYPRWRGLGCGEEVPDRFTTVERHVKAQGRTSSFLAKKLVRCGCPTHGRVKDSAPISLRVAGWFDGSWQLSNIAEYFHLGQKLYCDPAVQYRLKTHFVQWRGTGVACPSMPWPLPDEPAPLADSSSTYENGFRAS